MMYMLIHYADEAVGESPQEEDPAAAASIEAWLEEMAVRGIRLHGDRLRPVADATTVRIRDNALVVSDGPFAETKEQIAGYDVIECADLDEAIEVASKHPVARFGTVEVRPFWPL